MRALRAARAVDAPDWLIGAGVVRECVWAHLHGIAQPAPTDVDPRRATAEHYRQRLEAKQVAARWPRVRILDAAP